MNPLGTHCMRCEDDVLKLENELDGQIAYQFVPLLNMQTINNTLESHKLNLHDLTVRNNVSDTIFQIIMDYKAALFQGRKRGRSFLVNLQRLLVRNKLDYSRELGEEVAQEVKLDLEMFGEDRRSKLALQSFHDDQKMANEMGVHQPSSAVVFDTRNDSNGLLINNFDYYTLLDLYQKHGLNISDSVQSFAASLPNNHQPNLHVL
ncbi:dithiol-disulfide isomerase [Paucilactobacillus suebicus DSM 5007 = KCTC 3549]|uniref:Dithiol-disulfide isomerase n=1 Tax=Paucilactobacillus suebicus DSM 5007 = KCTC 3549 TaxID=1423807 RepID=A0A0R1W415_9LACO|nr:dithiol-disulfide isomerase [Paucilactobacillus suebicus DSM 5007 = KCTC 3549]